MAIEDLPQMVLLPLRDSYNVTLGNDVVTTQFEKGMPRQRLGGVGSPHQLSVTFRHKGQHQEYLYSFWELYKTKSFAMRLIIGSPTLSWFECRFLGSPTHTELGADVHEFSIGLVVKPKRLDLDVSAAYLWAYQQTGGDVSLYFNALEKLVNEDLPDALGSLNA